METHLAGQVTANGLTIIQSYTKSATRETLIDSSVELDKTLGHLY